jgi:hypothetical protein
MLRRRGLPLAVAAISLTDDAELMDLDDPAVLRRRRLRPSVVATRDRSVTQPQALDIFRGTDAAGLRWWSIHESLWTNYTVFDRIRRRLRIEAVRAISLDDTALLQAADFLGLPPG